MSGKRFELILATIFGFSGLAIIAIYSGWQVALAVYMLACAHNLEQDH